MLIEQIIEFELSEPGPGRLCTPKTGYFYDNQKSPRQIFEWIIIY